jgi:eukaryotic-like serine/threonine-protein kinase
LQDAASGLLKPEAIDPFIGTLFEGKYRIESKIGEGGMGAVYRATHIFMERPVAIKFLHGEHLADSSAVERFKREARAAGRIQHPNATAVTDFGVTSDNVFYLVMEYLEGRSLRDRLRAEGACSLEEAVRIMTSVCEAVDVAHKKDIIHRDLKPDNVFLQVEGDNEIVKVLDFGIAKLTNSGNTSAGLTSAGMIVGTPYYMSPEQCQGDTLDPGADIYSLGIILFEMLTNKLPFTGESPLSIVLKHVSEMPPSPQQFNPEIPDAVEAVIMKALAKRRQDRHATAIEFAEDLGNACGIKVGHRTTGAYSPIIRTSSFTAGSGDDDTIGSVAQSSSPSPVAKSGSSKSDNLHTQPMGAMPTQAAMPAHGTIAVGAQQAGAVKGKTAKKSAGSSKSEAVSGETLETPSQASYQSEIETTQKSKMPIFVGGGVLLAIVVIVAIFVLKPSPGPVVDPGVKGPVTPQPTDVAKNMVKIGSGAFFMGRDAGVDPFGEDIPSDQTPSHPVSITKPYLIGKYEVTNREYKQFILESGYKAPVDWKDNTFAQGADMQPISGISWNDAVAYCQWLAKKENKPYRLPTEEEWEYAARGPQSQLFTWGNTFEPARANTREFAGTPLPIDSDSLAKDTSHFGVIGMTGNVSEWTSSDRKLFPGNKELLGGNPGDKVVRGTNYKSAKGSSVTTLRIFTPPTITNAVLGFRVAMDATEGQK